jgi:hypothetical protein
MFLAGKLEWIARPNPNFRQPGSFRQGVFAVSSIASKLAPT